MLYMIDEINLTLPQDEYDYATMPPTLIKKALFRYERLAQNGNVTIGEIEGDLKAFYDSGIEYEEVTEIPYEFNQICLPQEAGRWLPYEQLKAWQSLAEVSVGRLRDANYLIDLDFRLSMIELGL